jgi:hypothetical protein
MTKATRNAALRVAVGLACAVGAGAAAAKPPWRTPAAAASQAYRYEVREHHPGAADSGTRMDFRLVSDGKGGLVADIARIWTLGGSDWTPVTVGDDCLAKLHARPGEIAETRLLPMTPERAKLGEAFLSTCAPETVFTPLTDLLNVALIVSSERFHGQALSQVGQTEALPGFSTQLTRGDFSMAETSDAGEVTLVSLDRDAAAVAWKPSPSSLQIRRGVGPALVNLSGREHFAFQVTIDRRTGQLADARSIYDDLDLEASGPAFPAGATMKLSIHREVSIRRAGD